MLGNLSANCAYVALENPRWAQVPGDPDRVYGVELVQFDDENHEITREYLPMPANPYYPTMSDLQALVVQVNERRRDRR